jgi:aldehyde dehydrogenase (NAD+)
MMISNFVSGTQQASEAAGTFDKINPHTGAIMYPVTVAGESEVDAAIVSCQEAFAQWSETTTVRRGQILGAIVQAMRANADELAGLIASETGKPPGDAMGEVGGSIAQGEFFAGEGMRLFGRTLNSGMEHKYSFTVRQPHGVCGLIVPANTPLANITWKVFPALICGNTAILKASEDAPRLALRFAEIAREAGLSDGVLNVLQGRSAGPVLVRDPRVALISFTGSTEVGKSIARDGGERLARVSLEMGGKNPFIVCDDANMDNAVHWASLSAFSNAGQRCSSGSRLLVQSGVYDSFVSRLIEKAESLRLGIEQGCDLGPVVSRRQRDNILIAIETAKAEGGMVLTGGGAPDDPALTDGFYIQPTLIEGLSHEQILPNTEIFGPVATLHRFDTLQEALQIANATSYGLTASIHTTSLDRGMWFSQRVRAGAANINIATFGSEPHMPFGGFGDSGNGTREPGTEALDVYSELKTISVLVRPDLI